MNGFILVLLSTITIVVAHEHGAPCAAQYTMHPNPQYHGPPQEPEENPVPYYFSITDSKGQPITHYRGDEIYTVRLYGGKSYFRGFLIQARLATRERFVIGHLRSGEFLLEPESLERYGVQIQPCPPVLNDSVTHVDSSEKKFLEINWRVSQNDGPLQFVLTVVKDRHVYWQEWKPDSGFLLPQEGYNFKKQASQKYGSSKLSHVVTATSLNPPEIIDSNTISGQLKKLKSTTKLPTDTLPPSRQIKTTTIDDYDYVESSTTVGAHDTTGNTADDTEDVDVVTQKTPSIVVQKSTNTNASVLIFRNFSPKESVRVAPSVVVREGEGELFPGDKGDDNSSLKVLSKTQFVPKLDPKKPPTIAEIAKKPFTTESPIGDEDDNNGRDKNKIKSTTLLLLSQPGRKFGRTSAAPRNTPTGAPRKKTGGQGSQTGGSDPCSSQPCQNNGGCVVDTDGGYVCNCTENFAGFDCSQFDYCAKSKCKNGAACVNDETDYRCECDENFAGKFCQVKCPSTYCENDGECIADENDRPSCTCAPGFTGDRCQTDIDECQSNPCVAGATCENRKNAFHCICPDGYMGERCHRPCQDIYQSCSFWKDQDQCELRRPSTNFFDVNCAVSCEQCVFDNNTVVTDMPLPPALEPLEFILGQWYVNSSSPKRVPLDFENSPKGYYEEVEFSVPFIPMFGTPSVNYSAVAVSHADKTDVRYTVGFMTLKPNVKPTPVSLMTTENDGITLMEEGLLKDGEIQMEIVYLATFPDLKTKVPPSIKRTLGVRNGFLQESVVKTDENGKEDQFTKYYYRRTS